ncbi:MAG: C45 family autoproteolytic acyltransferase/hydrolase [Bacillaceae bacterium]
MPSDELIVKVIDLYGSYYEMGLQQGRELLSSPALVNEELLAKMTTGVNTQKAKLLLQQFSPNIFEELRGLATGVQVDLDYVLQLYSGYDMAFPPMGCTSFLWNGTYVRNYDFSPDLYDARLVLMRPKNGYASVGFSQQVIGRLDGMNEKGLVVGLHFVNNEYCTEGFMATTIVRMLLEQCENIEQATNMIKDIPHAYCYNYSMTDMHGKGVIVQASPEKQLIQFGDQLICTNHFESEKLQQKNRKDIQSSIMRKKYLNELSKQNLSNDLLYQQFNNGKSPLFFKYYQQFFGTLHTVMYSPKDLSITVGIGENSVPHTFTLSDFIEEKLNFPKMIKGKISLL